MKIARRTAIAWLGALTATQAAAQSPTKLAKIRVGILRLASSGAVFIALAKGYFRDQGLDVELVFFDAAQPIAVAAASGDIDIGVTAFTTGLFNLAAKGALSVIAGQSREAPGFPLIAYLSSTHAPASMKMYKPQDLIGHSVGITQTGSSFHYSLGLLAAKYHFPLAEIHLSALQSLSNVAAALKGGAVDAALLPITTARPLIEANDARLLGWVGDITPWQLGAVFVSRRFKTETDAITRFLVAYRQGLRAYHDVLLATAVDGAVPVTDATRPLLQIIADTASQTIDQVRVGLPYVDPDGTLDVADVANQIKWNQEQGYLDKGFGIEQVVDRRFVAG